MMKFFDKIATATIYAAGVGVSVWAVKEDAKNAASWRAEGKEPPVRYIPGIGAYTPAYNPDKAAQHATTPGRGM